MEEVEGAGDGTGGPIETETESDACGDISFDKLLWKAIDVCAEEDLEQQTVLKDAFLKLGTNKEDLERLKRGLGVFGRNSDGCLSCELAFEQFDAEPDLAKALSGEANTALLASVRDLIMELCTCIARWESKVSVDNFVDDMNKERTILNDGWGRLQTCHAVRIYPVFA